MVNGAFGPSTSAFNAAPVVLGLFLAGVIAFMIVSLVLTVRSSRRRRESIMAIVTANGLSYVPNEPSLVNEFVGDPFGKGTSRRAGDVVAGTLAGHDLNTESAEFKSQWRVRANDERVAHAILTGPMIERLPRADVRERAVVFQGMRLVTFAPQASSLTDLASVIGMLREVAGLIPPFLLKDLGGPETA